MRSRLLVSVAVLAGCGGGLQVPRGAGIPINAVARANLRVHAQVYVPPPPTVTVSGSVSVSAPTPPVPTVVTNTIQPLENAPIPEFFGIPLDGGGDVVFVLDVSGSMDEAATGQLATYQVAPDVAAPPPPANGPPPPPPPPTDPNAPPPAPPAAPAPPTLRKIDVAKAELVEALRRLPPGTRMNVLFFNSELEGYSSGLFPLEDGVRGDVISFVNETDASGRTALAPAMRTAFLMNARRIVLLSDGLGNVGGGADNVLRDAREAVQGGGVRIDTIGLGVGQDGALLARLANESGGLYQAL